MRYVQHVSTFLLLAAGFLLYASANADVKEACEIQERLTLLGLDPGPIDGVVGNKTKDAVSSFLAQIETQKKKFTGEEVVSLLRRFKRINTEGNEIKASVPTVNRPMNGKEFFDIPQNSIAPLKIRTADQGYDYYIKLSNIDTGGTSNPLTDPIYIIFEKTAPNEAV